MMKKLKSYYKDNLDLIYLVVLVVLISLILIRFGLCANIIKHEWLRSISYDLGIGLLGTAITIVFVDQILKQIESKREEKQKRKDKYDTWRDSFEQDVQITSRNISNIREMIDIILEIYKEDGGINDKANTSDLVDMLCIQIRLLASNPPIRESFNEFDRIEVGRAYNKTDNYLTAKDVVVELNSVLETLVNDFSSFRNNIAKLRKIKVDLLKAQVNFLKLKAKRFDEYYKEELT